MKLSLLVLFALVGLAVCAAPSTPTWPKAFSASVLVSSSSGHSYFWRWFHDLSANMARLDGFIQWGENSIFTETLIDENAKQEYVVLYPPNQVSCYVRDITRPLINPDFSEFEYLGLSLINFDTCNQWGAKNQTSGNFFMYFEDAESREPVRFIMFSHDGHEEVWNFWEFDAATQDPALFTLSSTIKGICNPQTEFSNKVSERPIMPHKI